MKYIIIVSVFVLALGCEDSSTSGRGSPDSEPRLLLDSTPSPDLPDIPVIPFIPPDAYVDPCENVTSSSEYFCECEPQCCQVQIWYCPPNGLNVNGAEVVMNICDDNLEICDRAVNLNCPPNEVLSRSSCRSIQECPPNLESDLTITVQCEIEGQQGTQEILCTKGNIQYGECVVCEPGEERCNYEDDDCDGQVDEEQTNRCGMCGPIPSDVCNGFDDDCDGQVDENLVRECATLCERGIETCSAGNWISCSAVQPTEEECNGADDDCDGQIDEQLNCLCTIEDVGELQPCSEPPLLCGQGFKMCECANEDCTEMRMTDCQAICAYFPPAPPVVCDARVGIALAQEMCNNFDEDCDQDIDENLTSQCYTGDVATLDVGLCVSGEVYCRQGVWGNDNNGVFDPGLCLGEVTPQNEICDNQDNDCDGVTDYGDTIRDTDILFIVDWSGSMDDEINAVRSALNRFAQHYSDEEALQWGLIVGPKAGPDGRGEFLIKVSDIAPFDAFLQSFSGLGNQGMDTGAEMLRDAIYLSIQNITAGADIDIEAAEWVSPTGSLPAKEEFVINWRQNSDRIVIVFTDEEPQTFLRPRITDENVINAIQSALNLKFYAFVPLHWAGNQWQDIIDVGNGRRFRLTDNPTIMYNDLMSIIDEACLPRPEEQASIMSEWLKMSISSVVPETYKASWDFIRMCY